MVLVRTRAWVVATWLMIAAAATVFAGCGGDDAETRTAPRQPTRETEPVQPVAEKPEEDVDEDREPPTPAALAAGRRFEALVNAYAPVSARFHFLVAAETLRQDAVAGGAPAEVEIERSGSTKLEADRMRAALIAARPRVAAVRVAGPRELEVRRLMLVAIDARTRAVGELRLMLATISKGQAGDSEIRQLEEQWSASWGASMRASRTAMTTMQTARDDLGLEPAPEEGIR